MNTETNFMSFENLTKLIEEHKKETHPYKKYEFDSTSYTLLLIDINNLIKENKQLKEKLDCDLQWAFKYEKQVDNWNKLKKLLNQKYYNGERIDIKDILDIIQELEQGSDNDEQKNKN